MNKPRVLHAGCGGLVVASQGTIVCSRCHQEVTNQLEWIHERLQFKPERASVALDEVRP